LLLPDIKSENFMLDRSISSGDARVVLIDLCGVRTAESHEELFKTRSGATGTRPYAHPQLISDEEAIAKPMCVEFECYALLVTCFEVLAGGFAEVGEVIVDVKPGDTLDRVTAQFEKLEGEDKTKWRPYLKQLESLFDRAFNKRFQDIPGYEGEHGIKETLQFVQKEYLKATRVATQSESRVGGRPIEQWERDWIGTINKWVLKIDKFAFYTSMKNDFAQDKKELKAVLEGLSGTMQRSERHNIMKEMRTISETIVQHFVRRLLRARSKEFVLQLQEQAEPDPDWLWMFKQGTWYRDGDVKVKKMISIIAKNNFDKWTRDVRYFSSEDRKKECEKYTIPKNGAFHQVVALLKHCAAEPDAIYGSDQRDPTVNRAWLHPPWGHTDPGDTQTRFQRLISTLEGLHSPKVNKFEHQAQNMQETDTLLISREDIDNEFLQPLGQLFGEGHSVAGALMY